MKPMTRTLALWAILAVGLVFAQASMARDLPDFTELVEQAAPGVVNISTTRMAEEQGTPFGPFGGQDMPEIFRHFFGDRMPFPPGRGRSEERRSLGSGFVIDSDGYIMTNAHVVAGADEIMVRLNDRRDLKAELVGADEKTDVAVLKVDASDLPTLNLGDSDGLKVGEWVAAIGSPFGFDHSVTAGIISAINRTLPRDAYVPFIQTDVAINPGNSGGPLFNLKGEVIGINSQIFTRSGGFMGLSFAIPINVAMDVANQLRETGHVSRGWLGVMIQPVSRDLAESFGMDQTEGALIADVDPDGPAARDGIRAGDIILEVNGERVETSGKLPRLIGRFSPDSEVKVTLLRNGKEQTVTVTVGDWPEDMAGLDSRFTGSDSSSTLGLVVEPLSDAEAAQLGVESGVQIVDIDPRGVAANAGMRPGDVLVSINHQAVENARQLSNLVSKLPTDRAVPVRLYRNGHSLFIALRMGADGE